MNKNIIVAALVALALSACSTTPQLQTAPVENRSTGNHDQTSRKPLPASGGYLDGDGPGDNPPANIDAIPDAIPVFEPLNRFANRPYQAENKNYTPLTVAGSFKERGIASWYGKKFQGHATSSGEKYDMYLMTAAHPTLPIPSYARVSNVVTGKTVVVRINDRGPFLHDRAIDLSYTAAHKLGITGHGSSEVEIESITADTQPVAQSVRRPVPQRTARIDAVQSTPLEPVATTPLNLTPATEGAASNVFLQLGAFNTQLAAQKFLSQMQAKLVDADKKLSLLSVNNMSRVYLGPYASLDDARSSRVGLKDKLGFMPMVSAH